MLVKLGFVAMSTVLEDKSPSGTTVLKTLNPLNPEDRRRKLWAIAEKNIKNTIAILQHAYGKGILVYRYSSKLVPFATHEISCEWDYIKDLAHELQELGTFVKERGIRISCHPDHFTVINTPKEEVFKKSVEDLIYHNKLFQAMGIGKEGKMVIHVGGAYGNKEEAKTRFVNNFKQLPCGVKERLILENDDKVFTPHDVLEICQSTNIPMVFDVHHYHCTGLTEPLKQLLPKVFATWGDQVPKVHFSSPKSEIEFRSHSDYINPEDFLKFLWEAKEINRDFDIMLEAKQKDGALLQLVKELKKQEKVEVIDNGIIKL